MTPPAYALMAWQASWVFTLRSMQLWTDPMAATSGRVTLAEVENLVEPGAIDPDHVLTPGIFINHIFQGTYGPKRIEKRTNRPASGARA